MKPNRTLTFWAVAAVAFGGLTIFSGGLALFGSSAARASVGNAVDFVLWFNFAAGFFYVMSGVGLFLGLQWAAWIAVALGAATALVAVAFGMHVAGGGLFEMRTVAALVFRLLFWIAVAVIAMRSLKPRNIARP